MQTPGMNSRHIIRGHCWSCRQDAWLRDQEEMSLDKMHQARQAFWKKAFSIGRIRRWEAQSVREALDALGSKKGRQQRTSPQVFTSGSLCGQCTQWWQKPLWRLAPCRGTPLEPLSPVRVQQAEGQCDAGYGHAGSRTKGVLKGTRCYPSVLIWAGIGNLSLQTLVFCKGFETLPPNPFFTLFFFPEVKVVWTFPSLPNPAINSYCKWIWRTSQSRHPAKSTGSSKLQLRAMAGTVLSLGSLNLCLVRSTSALPTSLQSSTGGHAQSLQCF